MRLRQLAGTHGHIAWQHHIQPRDSSSFAPPVQPDQTGQSGISALPPPFSLMPALPGRGVVSASVAAPPEDDPKVLNALSFLTFDGQDQVPQAAASTVKVQMILETEIRYEPLYHLHQAGEAHKKEEEKDATAPASVMVRR